jgi:pyruvate formate lyase activating enzyme
VTGDAASSPRDVRGVVFDIQRYSLHDGPGLRTNVFLKGCGLSCQWCSNPEAKRPTPQIAFFERVCFLCQDCIPICPDGAISLQDDRVHWDHARCSACGRCVEVCTAKAFTWIGKEMTAGSVIDEVLRDSAFYSGQGGLTLTGGEPAVQPEFARAILQLARQEGLHTAIETCGAVSWQNLESLLPYLDVVLFDMKHIDPETHRRFTGASNVSILENLRRTAASGVRMVVRVPLIPGFNTDEDTLRAMGKWIKGIDGIHEIHVLAYHTLGRSKYKALNLAYPLEHLAPMHHEEAERWAGVLRAQGFEVLVGG